MDISCAFPATPDSPEHIAVAEELGYRRAWLCGPDLHGELERFMKAARGDGPVPDR